MKKNLLMHSDPVKGVFKRTFHVAFPRCSLKCVLSSLLPNPKFTIYDWRGGGYGLPPPPFGGLVSIPTIVEFMDTIVILYTKLYNDVFIT